MWWQRGHCIQLSQTETMQTPAMVGIPKCCLLGQVLGKLVVLMEVMNMWNCGCVSRKIYSSTRSAPIHSPLPPFLPWTNTLSIHLGNIYFSNNHIYQLYINHINHINNIRGNSESPVTWEMPRSHAGDSGARVKSPPAESLYNQFVSQKLKQTLFCLRYFFVSFAWKAGPAKESLCHCLPPSTLAS